MFDREDSSTSDKLIIGTVAVIGIVTMVFGFLQVKKSIFSPFMLDQSAVYKTPAQQHQEALALLKTSDTDGDGLTDHDELYVFRTNPYLEDTDSDGIDDGEEVNSNTDPNCPKGKSCMSIRTTTGSNQPDGSGQEDEMSEEEAMAQAFIAVFGDPRELTREQANQRLLELSSETLRQFFVLMGVSQEAVEDADYETLRQLAIEALKEVTFKDDITSESGE